MVEGYAAGELIAPLAARFGVDPVTLQKYVRAAGVPKRLHWLGPRQLEEAIELYTQGRSIKFIAGQFRVGATTVRRALKKAGVDIAPRGRSPRSATPDHDRPIESSMNDTDCRQQV